MFIRLSARFIPEISEQKVKCCSKCNIVLDKQIGGSSIATTFSDNIFYCPGRATCLSFLLKPASGTGIKTEHEKQKHEVCFGE